MEKISQQTINQRFIEFVDKLKESGTVRSDADFARSIGINPGQLSDIRAKVKDPSYKKGKNTTSSMLTTTLMVYKAIDWLLSDMALLNEIVKKYGHPDTQAKVRELEAYKNFVDKALQAKDAELALYKEQLRERDLPSAG